MAAFRSLEELSYLQNRDRCHVLGLCLRQMHIRKKLYFILFVFNLLAISVEFFSKYRERFEIVQYLIGKSIARLYVNGAAEAIFISMAESVFSINQESRTLKDTYVRNYKNLLVWFLRHFLNSIRHLSRQKLIVTVSVS